MIDIDIVKEMIMNGTVNPCTRSHTEIEYKGKNYTFVERGEHVALFAALQHHNDVEEVRNENGFLLAYLIPTTDTSVTVVLDGGYIGVIE